MKKNLYLLLILISGIPFMSKGQTPDSTTSMIQVHGQKWVGLTAYGTGSEIIPVRINDPIVPAIREWKLSYNSPMTIGWGIGGFFRIALNKILSIETFLDYHRMHFTTDYLAGWMETDEDYLGGYEYDQHWNYRYGQLEFTPLIRVEAGRKFRFLAAMGPSISMETGGRSVREGTQVIIIVPSGPKPECSILTW